MARRVSREQMRKIQGGTATVAPQPGAKAPGAAMKMHTIKMEHVFDVTADQKKAFDALPKELQAKLRAPGKGQKVTLDGLSKKSLESTIMCAW